ncbi:MAG: inner membrane-spanning protein YciB [Sphingomicrobium sp.]|nr:septation protein IspZ [Sphingomonadales bacterium]
MTAKKRELSAGVRLLLDLGPLVLFFIANAKFGVFTGTAIFIVGFVVSLLVSLILTRKLSALQLFSGFLVIVMGGLTLWLHNEAFIKIKPTLYYAVVSALLFFGLVTGRPLLRNVLGSAYPGLSKEGWDKLTRNWAFFFLAMALANEAVWRNTTTAQWIVYKLWIALPATFVFALANLPMLIRHGLNTDDAKAEELPPE